MPTSYQGIGLNSYLQPQDSPIARRNEFVSGYQFDSTFDRGVVKTLFIQDGAIQSAKIEDAAITTAKIADASITNAKIVSLSASKISAGTIDASTITVTNLNATNISTGTLSMDRIATNAITASKIAANTITASEIASDTITSNQIATNTITANRIASNAITADEIATDAVTAIKIKANAVTASKIDVDDLSAINADLGTVTAGSITGVTITGGTIRTAASGSRVEMSGTDNELRIYSSTTKIIQMDEGGAWIRTNSNLSFGGTSPSGKEVEIRYDSSDGFVISKSVNVGNSASIGYSGSSTFRSGISMASSDITSIDQLTFSNSSQYINTDSNDMRVHVEENFEVYKGSTIKAIIDNNIWTAGTYSEGCFVFTGDPFEVLKTIVGQKDKEPDKKGGFVSLDHNKVHEVLKSDFKDKNGVEHKGMNLSGLVKVQNKAILQLADRLAKLEAQYNLLATEVETLKKSR